MLLILGGMVCLPCEERKIQLESWIERAGECCVRLEDVLEMMTKVRELSKVYPLIYLLIHYVLNLAYFCFSGSEIEYG